MVMIVRMTVPVVMVMILVMVMIVVMIMIMMVVVGIGRGRPALVASKRRSQLHVDSWNGVRAQTGHPGNEPRVGVAERIHRIDLGE